jgi:hypothetical protein
MDDLIKALMIFRTYTNDPNPTHCEHDVMYVTVDPDDVSVIDMTILRQLGFFPCDDMGENIFKSFRFGSC